MKKLLLLLLLICSVGFISACGGDNSSTKPEPTYNNPPVMVIKD